MGFIDDLMDISKGTAQHFIDSVRNDPFSTESVLFILSSGAHTSYRHTMAAYEKFFPLPEEPPEERPGVNHQSNVWKRPVIYGTRGRVGGNVCFLGSAGDQNKDMWMVLDICEGEIEAIDEVYINDVVSTDAKFSGLLSITKYTGTETQAADAALIAAFPGVWTASHQLKGVAYLVLKLTFDTKAYGGLPRVSCNVRGKKVYDPRTTTTYFSNTPALCHRDYFTNTIYGKGSPAAQINDDYITAAADYQETLVQKNDGSADTFPLLTCDLILSTSNKIIDNLKKLMQANRAGFPRVNGKYCLVVKRDETPVFDFDSTNILGGWSFTAGGLRSRFNEAEVKFSNADTDWKSDTLPITSAVLFAEDGGNTLSQSITADWVTDAYHAADLANLIIKESRQQIAVSFIAAPGALICVPGAIVTVTHDTPGWAAKTFRVAKLDIIAHGLVGVSLAEHEPTVYDRDVPVEQTTPPDTNLVDPNSPLVPSGIVLSSGDDYLKLAGDGTVISRIFVEWVESAVYPYTIQYDVEYKAVTDSDWIPADSVAVASGANTFIGPVDDGFTYHVRIRTVGPNNATSAWVESAYHIVIGKLAPPPNVDSLSVIRQADGTRQFSWALSVPPADLAGYKLRYKLSPDQAWDDMLPLHEGLLLSSPHETNLLAAGVYTMGVKAVDTSGNESAAAMLINSTLGDPRIAASLYGIDVGRSGAGWPGTLTDCWHSEDERVLYADNNDTWDDLPATWDAWTSWNTNPSTPVIYEHTAIDLGAILQFTPVVSVSGNGTFTVEEAHSDDDITYTSWAVPAGQISARYIKVKVTCAQTSGVPSITGLFINLSADVIDESINDLDTSTISSPAGTFRLPIAKTYTTITQIQIALQGVGGGWSWVVIDKDAALGPLIKIYNATPALADATIDVYVKGV